MNCPSCNSELKLVNDQLYCLNSKECPAQNAKGIEHFCKAVKIKGLGPKRIEALELNSIAEIYSLTESYMAEKIGAKVAATLMAEINKAKNPDFGSFIYGMGIPLIGQAAATKIASQVASVEAITLEACTKAGLKGKAVTNLLNWVKNYSHLPVVFDTIIPTVEKQKNLARVCISGKLTGYTKAQATELLTAAGYEVVDRMSRVDILITEQTVSEKYNLAVKCGLPIGTLQEVLDGHIQPLKPQLII